MPCSALQERENPRHILLPLRHPVAFCLLLFFLSSPLFFFVSFFSAVHSLLSIAFFHIDTGCFLSSPPLFATVLFYYSTTSVLPGPDTCSLFCVLSFFDSRHAVTDRCTNRLDDNYSRETPKPRYPKTHAIDSRGLNSHHGSSHQEPLGTAHCYVRRSLYVHTTSPDGVGEKCSARGTAQLTHISDQLAATIEAFFWPKIFWDFLTRNLDPIVKPVPILQIINLLLCLFILAWEWPLNFIAGTAIHRSLESRLAVIPLAALASVLLYQGTNAAIYYVIGMMVYFWAYSEGEVSFSRLLLAAHLSHKQFTNTALQIICAKPWSLPQRARPSVGRGRV